MLTPEEEQRLEAICEDIGCGTFRIDSGDLPQVTWLIRKLKEVNEELKKASWNIPGCTCSDTGHYRYCPVICEHSNTTRIKDLQEKDIDVCANCDSIIEVLN